MKKRVWIIGILVAVLVSMYATTAKNTVNSVEIYFVSYTVGKLYAMTYVVAGIVALALWGCVICFLVKNRKQWITEVKAKKAERKQSVIQQKTVSKLETKPEVKEKATPETKPEKMQKEKAVQPPVEVSKEVEKVETKEETKTKVKTETKKEELKAEVKTETKDEKIIEAKAEVKLEKKCSSCGAILEEHAKFCTKCGNKVT